MTIAAAFFVGIATLVVPVLAHSLVKHLRSFNRPQAVRNK